MSEPVLYEGRPPFIINPGAPALMVGALLCKSNDAIPRPTSSISFWVELHQMRDAAGAWLSQRSDYRRVITW